MGRARVWPAGRADLPRGNFGAAAARCASPFILILARSGSSGFSPVTSLQPPASQELAAPPELTNHVLFPYKKRHSESKPRGFREMAAHGTA